MKKFGLIVLCLCSLTTMAWAIEEPSFAVIKHYPQFEVRQYQSYIVAEVIVPGPADKAGSVAFGYLGGYIFGKNKGSKKIDMTAPVTQTPAPIKIAMTAPVAQTALENGFLVQFTMPKNFTMETLPEPNDPKIKLREIPSQTFAVLTYSGSWSQSLYEENLSQLRKHADEVGLKLEGEHIFSRYNGPISLPFMRRNEIWIRVVM